MKKIILLLLLLLSISNIVFAEATNDDNDLYKYFYLEQSSNKLPYYKLPYNIVINKVDFSKSNLSIIDNNSKSLFSMDIIGPGKSFYFVNTRDKMNDLVYFFTDGSGHFLNDFKIVGEKDGKLQKLFDIYDIPANVLDDIVAGCQMSIYRSESDGLVYIVLSSVSGKGISISWDGQKYIYK